MISLLLSSSILSVIVVGQDWSCGSGGNACDPKLKIRLYDGSCNNIHKPQWGSVSSAYTRLLDAEYDDGESKKLFELYNEKFSKPFR